MRTSHATFIRSGGTKKFDVLFAKIQSSIERTENEDCQLLSNSKEVEALRKDTTRNSLITVIFEGLKRITKKFRQDSLLGGGVFGSLQRFHHQGSLRRIRDRRAPEELLLRSMMVTIASKAIGSGW